MILRCVSPHCTAELDSDRCPDHPDEDVMLLHPCRAMGVTRAPVLGANPSAPTRDEIGAVMAAVDASSGGRLDIILRAVAERLYFGAVTDFSFRRLDAADYRRVMAMSDVALRAHVLAYVPEAVAERPVAA